MWEIREVLVDHWFDFTSFFWGGGAAVCLTPEMCQLCHTILLAKCTAKLDAFSFSV